MLEPHSIQTWHRAACPTCNGTGSCRCERCCGGGHVAHLVGAGMPEVIGHAPDRDIVHVTGQAWLETENRLRYQDMSLRAERAARERRELVHAAELEAETRRAEDHGVVLALFAWIIASSLSTLLILIPVGLT